MTAEREIKAVGLCLLCSGEQTELLFPITQSVATEAFVSFMDDIDGAIVYLENVSPEEQEFLGSARSRDGRPFLVPASCCYAGAAPRRGSVCELNCSLKRHVAMRRQGNQANGEETPPPAEV